MSVEDLLDWIDRRNLSGSLTVEWASVEEGGSIVRSFMFDAGFIIGSSSNQPGEHVGQLLLRAGLLDQETLDSALAAQAELGTPLSTMLSSMGAVEDAQLRHVLEEQAREALLDSLVWPDGTFVFERGDEHPVEVAFSVSLRLRACIVQGRQRAHRWKRIRELVPGDDQALQVMDQTLIATAEDSDEVREELLAYVNLIEQGMNIEQMVELMHGRRFVVLDRLALLIERGAVAQAGESLASESLADLESAVESAVAAVAEPDKATAAEYEQAARRQATSGDSALALEYARQALALEPHNPDIQKLFRELERTVFAMLSRELLTSFRVPKLLVPRDQLDEMGLGDTERYLAGRIDGHWDLLSLLRVSPLREAEALITFKRLADRGIISL